MTMRKHMLMNTIPKFIIMVAALFNRRSNRLRVQERPRIKMEEVTKNKNNHRRCQWPLLLMNKKIKRSRN